MELQRTIIHSATLTQLHTLRTNNKLHMTHGLQNVKEIMGKNDIF
jgi:hypothetical protein